MPTTRWNSELNADFEPNPESNPRVKILIELFSGAESSDLACSTLAQFIIVDRAAFEPDPKT